MKNHRKHWWILGSALLLFGLSRLLIHLSAGVGRNFLLSLSACCSNAIRRITNLVPFSTMEIFLAVLGVLLALSLFFFFRYIYLANYQAAWLIPCKLALLGSILYFLFVILMGVCYNSVSVQEELGLSNKKYTAEQLGELTVLLAEKCNQTAQLLSISDYERSFSEYGVAVSRGYDTLKEKLPFLQGVNARPKQVLTSTIMCYVGIDGICFPFTAEANINRLLPSFALPNVMAHEIAHSCRVAREDEASFIGMLAAFSCGDDFVAYSSYQSAFIYAYNALYSEDAKLASRIYQTLDDAVLTDLKTLSMFYRSYQTKVQDVSSAINDSYLKAQGQSEGTKSYGGVVDLLIAWHLMENVS